MAWEGKPATNFTVEHALPLYSLENPQRLDAIELEVHAPDGTYSLLVDVDNALVSQIIAAIPTCRLLNNGTAGGIDAYLIEKASQSKERRVLFRHFGLQRIQGRWVFVAGNEILGDCGGIGAAIHPSVAQVALVGEKSADAGKAIRQVLRAMEQHMQTVLPTFCYTLPSSLRSQLMRLGLSTFPAIYLVGRQGYGKTVLATRYCLLYDRLDNLTPCGQLEANSTANGIIRALEKYRDQVVLVDDLAKGSDIRIQKQRKELMAETLRFASNDHVRQTAAIQPHGMVSQCCRAGVVFTGEISLTAASDLTRMIEIPLQYPMTGGQASDRADAAVTFRAWMTWLLPHLDEELAVLEMRLTQLQGGEDARLQTNHILLSWAAELFYRFALETGITSHEYYTSSVQVAEQFFDELLRLQARQVRRIQNEAPRGNFSFYIHEAYHNNLFLVAASRKQMTHKDDCVVEKGALCIRPETLLAYLHSKSCFSTLTKNQLGKCLRQEGALGYNTEAKSAAKRINGHRYLELDLEDLKNAAKEY